MRPLSEGQRGWLEDLAAMEYGMISRLGIEVGSGASIASLIKRGLAEWHNGRSFLRITDAGRAALRAAEARQL